MKNEILFTGRWLDKTTNLYYYRARWYDSDDGRFMSKDPIGFEQQNKLVSLFIYYIANKFNVSQNLSIKFINKLLFNNIVDDNLQFLNSYWYVGNGVINRIDNMGADYKSWEEAYNEAGEEQENLNTLNDLVFAFGEATGGECQIYVNGFNILVF